MIAAEDRLESLTSPLNVPYTDPDTMKRLWGEAASVAAMFNRGHGQGAHGGGTKKDGL